LLLAVLIWLLPAFTESEARRWLQQAQILFEREQWSECEQAVEKARQEDPQLADAYVLSGLIASRRSRFSDAEKFFREAIRLEPANYRTLGYLGATFLEEGRLNEAANAFHAVLRMEPADSAAQYNLGVIALSNKNAREARRYFAAVADRHPSDVAARAGMLETELALDDRAAARISASLVGRLLPPADPNRLRLGALLGLKHEYAAVVTLLEPTFQAGSASYETSYNLALAYFHLGQYDEAAKRVESALQPPRRAEALGLLGDIEEARHHGQEALHAFQEATELDPSNEDVWSDLGLCLLDMDKPAEAVAVFRKGLTHLPGAQRLQLGLAAAYCLSGSQTEAVKVLLELAVGRYHRELVYYLLGETYQAAPTEQDRITAAFETYLQQAPKDPWAYYNYGRILFLAAQQLQKRADYHAAIVNLNTALRMNPRLAEALLQLAEISQEQGRVSESVNFLQRAIALKPELSESHYRLAMAFQKLGLHERAAQELKLFKARKAEDQLRLSRYVSRQLGEIAPTLGKGNGAR
jgi:tetratricopeptide (TPR) repeat protein